MNFTQALSAFWSMMFGCLHSNYSFPLSPKDGRRPAAAGLTGMYVVCLECGKEFPYDWRQMKRISGAPAESEKIESFPAAEPVKSFANKAA